MKISLMFDLIILVLLLISYIMGYRRGAIKEFFSAISMVAAILISIPTYIRIGFVVQKQTGWNLIACQLVSFVGIFLIIAFICRIIAWIVQKQVEKSDFFSSFNKSFGGGLGLIKTLIILLFLGIIFIFIPLEYMNALPPSVTAVREHSMFLKFAGLFASPIKDVTKNSKHVKVYEKLMTDPEKLSENLAKNKRFQKFVQSEKVENFMNNKAVSKLLNDPVIKKYSEERNYVGLMKELLGGKGQALMNDPSFMDKNGISGIVEEFQDIILKMTDEVDIKKKNSPLKKRRTNKITPARKKKTPVNIDELMKRKNGSN